MRKITPNNIAVVATAVSLSLTACVFAEESRGYYTESGILVVPLLELDYQYDDNVGRNSSAVTNESSSLLHFAPGVAFESDRNGNQYRVAYQLESGTYIDSRDDDYLDHNFATNNFIRFNERNGLSFNYAYLLDHEQRGTGVFAGDEFSTVVTEPVEFQINNLSSTYVYGSEGAKGRLEPSLRFTDKRYQNFRDIGGADDDLSTRFKDYQELAGGVAFYYQAFGNAGLLFEIDAADKTYRLNDPATKRSQDSLSLYYLVGATWNISGKTDGKLRLGLQDKSYDDDQKEDFSGFSWDLELNWTPVEYSKLSATASQRADDPDQGSNFVEKTALGIDWKHQWLTSVYTTVDFAYQMDDYSDSDRSDDLLITKLAVGYQLRDYLDFVASWQHQNNDSTVDSRSYSQNLYSAGLQLTF